MEKQILIKTLDYILMICQLDEVRRMKNEAVQKQSYELATKFRAEEVELMKGIWSIEEMKAMRDQLAATNAEE